VSVRSLIQLVWHLASEMDFFFFLGALVTLLGDNVLGFLGTLVDLNLLVGSNTGDVEGVRLRYCVKGCNVDFTYLTLGALVFLIEGEELGL